jgi:hypothetical protein
VSAVKSGAVSAILSDMLLIHCYWERDWRGHRRQSPFRHRSPAAVPCDGPGCVGCHL